MELKQLYKDLTVLIGTEIPLPVFFVHCDLCARRYLRRYPKKLLLGAGEYISPENINDALAVDESFYGAVLYAIAGSYLGDAAYAARADGEAEDAYKALWRKSVRGKRRKGDAW